METRQNPAASADGQRVIACMKCELPNSHADRYCRQCGSSLWKKCAECNSERPIDEAYCAACGANIKSMEQRLIDTETTRLAEAEKQFAEREFHDALKALSYLAQQDHPALEEIRARAQQLLPEVSAERDRYLERADVHVGRAEILLEERRFEEAVAEINQIPPSLREGPARTLLQRANSRLEEIRALRQCLLQPEGRTLDERMESIDRLLELCPDDAQIQRWSTQIHNYLLGTANAKLKDHQYQDCRELLRSLPARLASDQSAKLLRHAEELAYLESVTQLAPVVNKVALDAANRLAKLDEGNTTVRHRLQEMTKRQQMAQAATGVQQATWTANPEKTYVGVPVEDCPPPQRLRFASAEVERVFDARPGTFLVACGLALQALGRAAIPLNLMPVEKKGVMGLLRAGRRERPATSGWGLDLSNSSLKAVHLTASDDGHVSVTDCFYHTHRLPLSHPDAAGTIQAILRETLEAFKSAKTLDAAQRFAMQWPSILTLARFLTIPALEGRKLRELVEREAQHQIPFPLSDVCWDWFTSRPSDNAPANRQLLLLATRRQEVETRLELLRECDIPVQIVQCDALALHNYLHFNLLCGPEQPAPSQQEQDSTTAGKESGGQTPAAVSLPAQAGIATLDVGSDATGIVYSFPDFAWFRAVRPADDDLVTAIARRFKTTREIAEQVKRDPTRLKRMSDLHAESCVLFRKLVGQYESAVAELEKTLPGRKIQQMFLAGGGGQTHDLLRFLRFGR
jgi:Tfp pilus assembly PilM family ATPase